jgi:hypothetical protein
MTSQDSQVWNEAELSDKPPFGNKKTNETPQETSYELQFAASRIV